jgi:arylsulfatase A-like enzyme
MHNRKRPNIILILTDDQRWDTIGALGNQAIRTPNLDHLVHSGTVFDNACIMGGTHVVRAATC